MLIIPAWPLSANGRVSSGELTLLTSTPATLAPLVVGGSSFHARLGRRWSVKAAADNPGRLAARHLVPVHDEPARALCDARTPGSHQVALDVLGAAAAPNDDEQAGVVAE